MPIHASKMITGWFKDVGVKNRLQVLDPGALSDRLVNFDGDNFAPDFDMYVWFRQGQPSPQFLLGLLTPDQISVWSDASWTDPRHTELFAEQSSNLDEPARRT